MISESAMLNKICRIVARNGKLIHKAQSAYGMDKWELGNITVGLGDDGYTDYISWGDRLDCHSTYGRDIIYRNGNHLGLHKLYTIVINEYEI